MVEKCRRYRLLLAPFALLALFAWLLFAHFRASLASLQLSEAVAGGQTERVRILLSAGADPDMRRNPPARSNGLIPWVRELLAIDRRPSRHGSGTPLLLTALQHERWEIARLLVQHDADPNVTDELGQTPLDWAIGQPDLVRLLLARHADPHREDRSRRQPLDFAIAGDDAASLKLLLDAGAELDPPSRRNTRGNLSPLALAVMFGRPDVVQILLDRGAALPTDSHAQYTMLATAIDFNGPEMARLLLDRGLSADSVGKDGLTALMDAAGQGNEPESVRLLLAHGAKVDRRDPKFRRTPLGWAKFALANPGKLGNFWRLSPREMLNSTHELGLRNDPDLNTQRVEHIHLITKLASQKLNRAANLRSIIEMLKRAGGTE